MNLVMSIFILVLIAELLAEDENNRETTEDPNLPPPHICMQSYSHNYMHNHTNMHSSTEARANMPSHAYSYCPLALRAFEVDLWSVISIDLQITVYTLLLCVISCMNLTSIFVQSLFLFQSVLF